MRLAIVASFLFASTAALPARAAEPFPDAHYSAGDWVGSFFAANAAGTVGALAGGGIGYALAGECHEDEDDESLFGGCFLHGFGEAAIGGMIGATFAGSAGIYAYGELTGHDGNYWAAAGGFAVGLVASLGLGVLVADTEVGSAMTWGALFTLPALGGTLGYVLSLDDGGQPDAPHHGALIEVDEGAFRLGVPDVGVTFDDTARLERVDVRLMAGRF